MADRAARSPDGGPAGSARRFHDLVLRRAVSEPDAPALVAAGAALSYAGLRDAMRRVAGLLQGFGVVPGDRVMIVAENDIATPVIMLAAQSLDAWPCIVNARVSAAEMEALRAVVEPRAVLFPASASREAAAFADALQADVREDGLLGRLRVACFAGPAPEPVHDGPADQTALILFTSGTTGLPKAVMLSHRALLDIASTLAQVRQVRRGGRYDGGAPLSHVMGICTLASVLHAGASLTLGGRLDVPDLAGRIADGTLTHLSFVPTVYARLLDHIRANGIDLSKARLEYISCGGAPLDPSLKAGVEALFGVRLVNGYGMTECCPISRTGPGRDFDSDSIGYPEPGAQIRIVREDGGDAAPGEVGEVWARAVGQMQGYYRNPQATAEALRPGGWMATGDLGTMAADGEVHIVGRRKEMIIRSGFNVYPAEVEAALNRHPAVLQCAVVGIRRPDGDEQVVAFAQARPGHAVSAEALQAHMRKLLAPYKCPERLYLREALPLGATGKILKRQLVDELAAAS